MYELLSSPVKSGFLALIAIATVSLQSSCSGGNGDSVPVDTSAGDARAAVLPALCTELCESLGLCFGSTPPASCASECTVDLDDCSSAELSDIETCLDEPPGDQCSELSNCLAAVDCVDAD